MVLFREFNTDAVHPSISPQLDTHYTIYFFQQFDALPLLSHGFRTLDADNNANICAEPSLLYLTKAWIDCHIMTWGKSNFYSAIDDIMVLVFKDRDFKLMSTCTTSLSTLTIPLSYAWISSVHSPFLPRSSSSSTRSILIADTKNHCHQHRPECIHT